MDSKQTLKRMLNIIKEMQVKTMRYLYIPFKVFKTEAKTDNTKSWQGRGVSGTLILLMGKSQKKELTLKMLRHILYVKVILNKILKKAQKISKNG